MYLSAERIAVANQAIKETFEQTSIAWQAIPHWDTGDPAQTKVRGDMAYAPRKGPDAKGPLGADPVEIVTFAHDFFLTVAQAIAPTPDALLDAVIARTVYLAADVDGKVIKELLAAKPQPDPGEVPPPDPKTVNDDIAKLLNGLIDARAAVENAGYRSPSCLLTNTVGFKALAQLDAGYSELGPLLDAASVNSRYRVEQLADGNKGKMLLLGRRQRIAHGGAAAASPGEEPVDLAISAPPSLEVIGENKNGYIELAVRIRFAPRVTDNHGVVGVVV